MSAFDEQFQTGPLAIHPHVRRGGGSLSTRMIRLNSPAHTVIDPPTDDLVIGLMVEGSAGARWAWDGAHPNVAATRRPGTLGLTPIGATGAFEVFGASTILIVALPYGGLARRLEPDVAIRRDFGQLHDVYVDHASARSLCRRLWRAAGTASFDREGRIDSLAESLLVALSGDEPEECPGGPGLSPSERAWVRARADRPDPDVASLAEAAAMPVRTFRRRFAASFGASPRHWLAQRRIGAAQRLLKARDLSLSEVALDLGFSSQAHFTDAFRRAVGVSPGRWRREVSG